jgi:hypothetical protein
LSSKSPLTYDEIFTLLAQGVGAVLSAYGLIRLFKSRILRMRLSGRSGDWHTWTPIYGELLVCAVVVLNAVARGDVANLAQALGSQIGLLEAAPVSGAELAAVSAQLVSTISIVRGILRRVTRDSLVISE